MNFVETDLNVNAEPFVPEWVEQQRKRDDEIFEGILMRFKEQNKWLLEEYDPCDL